MEKNFYSYSKLTCFENCQYDYYLTYIKGLRDNGETIYTFLGTACHEILELFQDGQINNEQAVEMFLNKVQDSDFLGLKWYSDKTRNDYVQSIIHFFENYSRYDNKVLMEQRFEIDVNDVLMKGFIDLVVFEDDNTISVYDYKTSTKFATKSLPNYGRQLVLYAYAMKKLNPNININNIGWNMLKYALIQGKRKIKPELRCNIEHSQWNKPYILQWKYDEETVNQLIDFITTTVNQIESKTQEDEFSCVDLSKKSYDCKMNCNHSSYCKHYQNYIKNHCK